MKTKTREKTISYNAREKSEFITDWEEAVKRIRNSGRDLGKIILVQEERNNV